MSAGLQEGGPASAAPSEQVVHARARAHGPIKMGKQQWRQQQHIVCWGHDMQRPVAAGAGDVNHEAGEAWRLEGMAAEEAQAAEPGSADEGAAAWDGCAWGIGKA